MTGGGPVLTRRALPAREVRPGWHGRFFDSAAMSFAHYEIDAGASLHEHSHPNEEVWTVLAGELLITIGGDTYRARPGSVAVVPPNTAHSVRALAPSAAWIVDHPLRGAIGGGERAALAVELAPVDEPGDAVAFAIANRGATPGTVVGIEVERAVAATLPPPVRTAVPAGPRATLAVVGASPYAGRFEAAPLGPAELAAVQSGAATAYLRGVVLYDDAAGERHHTTFCRIFDPLRGWVAPDRPGYNYGD